MTPTELQTALSDLFAPWVKDLGLQVQAAPGPGVVVARLPVSERLTREGGTLCGQAMMSAADTVMVLALIHHFGAFRPCTTVQQSSSFLRPLSGQDLLVEARVLRAGKALAFGEVDLRGADDGRSVCRVSSTCALL
ncbi:PaaI family thioesterase [Hydrogenophaga sp. IBVHS2]|uniref:PaaI family thioesterase n=1 Tax=Hydrogenophaga sp. IBVHS2 TaxID=1985170 RepID=UPI000A2EC33C|nr:PaaI family thioesterase [Hydrogenophaga sp. IBVHS2]OSZ63400.1 phenylacetic acid degradation protein [Hydrogenophaga sp. IBVHS2]